MLKIKKKSVFSIFICAAVFLDAIAGYAGVVERSQPVNNSILTIKIVAESGDSADSLFESLFSQAVKTEVSISPFRAESDFDKANKSAGKSPVQIGNAARDLLEKTFGIYRKTRGAFEPMMGTILNIYRFAGEKSGKPPKDEDIAELLPLATLDKIEFNAETGTLFFPHKSQRFDAHPLVRGRILETVSGAIRERGVKSFAVTLDGDVALGEGETGGKWVVALEDARKRGSFIGYIELSDTAVSTSGDYERMFVYNGRRYHHILDPKSGLPTAGVRSATVITGSAVEASAYSRAFLAMGVPDALKFCEAEKGIEAIIVDGEGRVHLTSGIKDRFKFGIPPKGFINTY
ncbi:MAG: FAD:protein FMN transferase [Myxococcota bacterium]